MGLVNINALAVLLLLLLLCLAHVHPNEASRILYAHRQELSLQSLQRGDLPPDDSSKCTYIPGTGGPGCPLKVKNYSGHGLQHHHHASAYPRLMVPFGVAANIHE